MKPEEKPAATLRPLGLTARQRMSPALGPLASRNSCYRAQRAEGRQRTMGHRSHEDPFTAQEKQSKTLAPPPPQP